MPLDSKLSLAIEKRLAEYLDRPQQFADLEALASRYSALPVYADIGGSLLLEATGKILRLDHTDGSVSIEDSEEWRMVAAIAATRKYPELAVLLPSRPTSAPDCPMCGGTGKVSEHWLNCGNCLGLGWKYVP